MICNFAPTSQRVPVADAGRLDIALASRPDVRIGGAEIDLPPVSVAILIPRDRDPSNRSITMSSPIENYALIGNLRTAALVDRTGSIDWLCLPRFDSDACFAALLGDKENGRWLLAPQGNVKQVRRKYRDNTLLLETEFETEGGVATVIDFMPAAERPEQIDLVRVVKGIRGQVPMRTEVLFRFDYGRTLPWVRRRDYGISAVSGPIAIALRTSVPLRSIDYTTVGEFTVGEGQSVTFRLTGYPSHEDEPGDADPLDMLSPTEQRWRDWAGRCSFHGDCRDAVVRSLITLKALTHAPPEVSSRRRLLRFPSVSAARATGIIDIAGCAIQPSRSTHY